MESLKKSNRFLPATIETSGETKGAIEKTYLYVVGLEKPLKCSSGIHIICWSVPE